MYFGVAFVYPFDGNVKTVAIVYEKFQVTICVGEVFPAVRLALLSPALVLAMYILWFLGRGPELLASPIL